VAEAVVSAPNQSRDLDDFRRRLLVLARRRGMDRVVAQLERAAETAREPQNA